MNLIRLPYFAHSCLGEKTPYLATREKCRFET